MMLAASIPDYGANGEMRGGAEEFVNNDGETYREIKDDDEMERLTRC